MPNTNNKDFTRYYLKYSKNHKNNLGFTLLELLVIVSIIGLISSMSIFIFNSTRAKARDAIRLADINEYKKLLTICQLEIGHFPDCHPPSGTDNCDLSSLYKYVTSCEPCSGNFQNALIQECPETPEFTKTKLNVDPINVDPLAYHYYYFPSGYTQVNQACQGKYVLMANLEITENPSSIMCTDNDSDAKNATPMSYWVILE